MYINVDFNSIARVEIIEKVAEYNMAIHNCPFLNRIIKNKTKTCGIYSGILIQLVKCNDPLQPFKPEEFGIECKDKDECRNTVSSIFENISRNITGENLDDTKKVISNIKESTSLLKNKFSRKAILEESIHALILSGTSANKYMKFNDLYNRLLSITLVEKIHELRESKRNNVVKEFTELYHELYFNIFKYKIFKDVVLAPILEPVTWYVELKSLRKDLGKKLERSLFFMKELNYELANEVIEIIKEKVKELGKDTLYGEILKISNETLNFTPDFYRDFENKLKENKIYREGKIDLEYIQKFVKEEVILNRFRERMSGKKIETSREKIHEPIVLYSEFAKLIKPLETVLNEILQVVQKHFNLEECDKLNEVKEIIAFMIDHFYEDKPIFKLRLSVENEDITIIYDPLVEPKCRSSLIPVSMSSRGMLEDIEDLLNSRSRSLRGFIDITHSLIINYCFKEENYRFKEENREKWVGVVKGWTGIDEAKLERIADEICREQSDLVKLLYNFDEEIVHKHIKLFLEYDNELGEKLEKLDNLYSHWFI